MAPLRAADAMARRYGVNSTPSFLIGRGRGELAKVDSGSLTSAIDDLLGR
jgi:protein-disulfide isomerase-like protein with CxxC motif